MNLCEDFSMSFGAVLRNILEERDISQRKMAQDLNMGASTVGNYIRDVREPDLKTVKRIADYFSVSTDYLLEHPVPVISEENHNRALQILGSLSQEDQNLWLEQGKLLLRLHGSAKPISKGR